ncbi:hypothetical protein FM107_05425 [Sphingobacterium sp. JB170]|nr:hypothetical protein FM107_05425 [Sphingobacterium sp. JB170]
MPRITANKIINSGLLNSEHKLIPLVQISNHLIEDLKSLAAIH